MDRLWLNCTAGFIRNVIRDRTLTNRFNSSLAALKSLKVCLYLTLFHLGFIIAWLVDKKRIKYTDTLASVWPEFGKYNKENITLEQLLGHRAGLTFLDRQPTLKEVGDLNILSQLLSNQTHNFNGELVQGYHAVTRGWYGYLLISYSFSY